MKEKIQLLNTASMSQPI